MQIGFLFSKIWKFLAIFIFVLLISSLLFYQFEYIPEDERGDGGYNGPDDIYDSFWYGIVTLSTVGYGDRFPVTTEGKIAALFLVIFTFTFLGAMIGMVSDAVMEARKREELGMEGTKFKKHIVICGWTSISRVSLEELLVADQNVVVITNDQNEIPKIRDMGGKKNLFVVFGQYSNRKVLNRANIKDARTVIVATGDDTETLIASLTIKSLNPEVRLIVSISEEELKKTLYSAGVTYVSSPAELTGRLVASAAFEPEVALFVEDITSATTGYDLQQYTIAEDSFAKGLTVKKFRERMSGIAGPLLVGVAIFEPKKGEKVESPNNWELKPNPDSDLKLKNNDIIIVLGDDDQNDKLFKMIKTPQGR